MRAVVSPVTILCSLWNPGHFPRSVGMTIPLRQEGADEAIRRNDRADVPQCQIAIAGAVEWIGLGAEKDAVTYYPQVLACAAALKGARLLEYTIMQATKAATKRDRRLEQAIAREEFNVYRPTPTFAQGVWLATSAARVRRVEEVDRIAQYPFARKVYNWRRKCFRAARCSRQKREQWEDDRTQGQ